MSATNQLLDWTAPGGAQQLRRHLAAGGLAVLPTDTVPGLAASAADLSGIERLTACKNSPTGRPYSLHLRQPDDLRRLVPAPPPGLPQWLSANLPGPWTVVVPRDWVALPRDWNWPWPAVGMRLPDHPHYLRFCAKLEHPLWMTSVNDPGRPPLRGAALTAWLAARPEVRCAVNPASLVVGTASKVLAFEPSPVLRRGEAEPAEIRPGLRVLILCSGNTCRSPLAAAMLRAEIAASWGVSVSALGSLGWVVESAGTYAMDGAPASPGSHKVAAEIGIDLSHHRTRHLLQCLDAPWDLLLGMGENHLAMLSGDPRAELLDPDGAEIGDPFGGSLDAYRRAREQIRQAIEARVAGWSRWPQPGR